MASVFVDYLFTQMFLHSIPFTDSIFIWYNQKENDLDQTPENSLTHSQQPSSAGAGAGAGAGEYCARHNGEERVLVPSVICYSKGKHECECDCDC